MIPKELKKHNVKEVVRVCEPTYKVEELKEEGINVIDLAFDDGTFPPNEVSLKRHFLNICLPINTKLFKIRLKRD